MTSPTITVASYNMRKAIGIDRRRNPDRVLHVLQEIDADIVALQEADKRFGTRASAVPHGLIDSHGLYKPVEFGVSHSRLAHAVPFGMRLERRLGLVTRNIGWHGNAILVKHDIEVTGYEALDLPTLEPRGAVIAELNVRGHDLRIVGMHLDLSGLWRRRQVRAILDHIARRHRAMPTVLMGDTNEWRAARGCLDEFRHGGFAIADTGNSFHARRPVAALDRIIVDNRLTIAAAGVHVSRESRKASDHLPIWARLTL